jgi:hypothetical protein
MRKNSKMLFDKAHPFRSPGEGEAKKKTPMSLIGVFQRMGRF